MRITLADGTPALAMVRTIAPALRTGRADPSLRSRSGRMARVAWRCAVLFATTTAVLVMIVIAYRRQVGANARGGTRQCANSQASRHGVKPRPLWSLGLGYRAWGRIYWSDSMYELLGMEQQSRCLSFGEIESRLHPEDGDLAALAEMVAASRTNSIDHEFRIRNSSGDWVWLRARAGLVTDEDGRDRHLVGIAVDVSEQRPWPNIRRPPIFDCATPSRRHLRSVCIVGRAKPLGHLQFEIPRPSWPGA